MKSQSTINTEVNMLGCILHTVGRHIMRRTFFCVFMGETHSRHLSKCFRYIPYTHTQVVCWALSITQDISCISHFTSWHYSYLQIGWVLYKIDLILRSVPNDEVHPSLQPIQKVPHSIQTTATSLKIKELLHQPKWEWNQILNEQSKYTSHTGYRYFPKI